MKSIIDQIGNTPIVRYKNIFVKLESFNPSGSVKDRPALAIVNSIKDGKLVEATSGNMGISLALIGREKGIDVTITMPENMSKERVDMMKKYGATVILTEKEKGMAGAIELAKKYEKEGYTWANQFSNILNRHSHHETAREIIRQLPNVDIIVCGIGTGGTISGIAEEMKKERSNVRIIGVEPDEAPVITKNKNGSHNIQGIGAGFIPDILRLDLIDEVVTVKSDDAINKAKEINAEGYSIGLSSAASIIVALELAQKNPDSIVLAIAPDGKEKYMSVLYA